MARQVFAGDQVRPQPRWLVFAGESDYPGGGGWDDFRCYASSFEEALDRAALLLKSWDWAHVVEPVSEMQVDVIKRTDIGDRFDVERPCWAVPTSGYRTVQWVKWVTQEDERGAL
jgi:hypothetical protein